ncbi:OmpA family protein [Nocardia farcinica]|uniref:OmpA family protein n=1 Tax=Nocardia farcinica TaxID=37329 RepID=UPI0024558C11|nr:OmpA family protein [Nocardia farcinica]
MAPFTVDPGASPTRTFFSKLTSMVAPMTAAGVMLSGVSGCTAPAGSSPTAITIVATATAAEPAPALPDSLNARLAAMAKAAKRPGQAVVTIITSGSGPVTTIDLVPTRANGQVQHAAVDAERQIQAALGEVNSVLLQSRADQPGLDLLGLLDRATQRPGEVHVISSGVSTTAPVDLRVVGWNTKPDATIDSIDRQGRIPSATDHHVTFYGLGVVAGSQPALPPFARSLLDKLWLGICARSGAAGCASEPGSITLRPPSSTLHVPEVPVPDAVTDDGCPAWASLSDTVLKFAPDSADLPADADNALRPLVDAARRCNVARIDLVGHIADTGTGDTRGDLAGRRARAVADRLLGLGLPPTLIGSVTGRDAREPVVPNFAPDGSFDEAKARQNRRVELTFVPSR